MMEKFGLIKREKTKNTYKLTLTYGSSSNDNVLKFEKKPTPQDYKDLKLKNKQFTMKQQDKQYTRFQKAIALNEKGKISEAIEILESIMYKEGLIVVGVTWPFVLSNIYYKNKMYDECLRYLDFIKVDPKINKGKIKELQAKIFKYKDKHIS